MQRIDGTSRATTRLAVGLLGVAVGVAWAWNPSVWFDEAATMSAVRRPVGALPNLLAHVDAVHGVYYLLAHIWTTGVGDSVVSLRALSALGLGVTAALTVGLTDRLATARVSVVAGVAVVLLPGLSWAGLEARSYAWSAALAVWSTLLLVAARERPAARRWAAYAVVLTLSSWLFLLSAVMVAVHAVALVVTDGRPSRGWFAAAGGMSLATLPLAWVAAGQRDQLRHIDLTHGGLAVRVGAQMFTGPRFQAHDSGGWIVAAAAMAVLVTSVVASGVVRRHLLGPHDRLLLPLAWAWAVLPTVVIAGPHLWGGQVYQVRYLTFSAPAVAILVALGLSTYGGRLRVALAVALVVAALPVLVSHHLPGAKGGDDYRGLAALARRWHPDDVVFSAVGSRGIEIAYPGPFRGTEDLLLQRSGAESGTLFGINAPPSALYPGQVRGRRVLELRETVARADPFARRLRELGCRQVAGTERPRFTATLLVC